MVFAESRVPDMTETIPTDISHRIAEAAAYVQSGARYDVAVGGLPFLLAISDQRPYRRQTADFRKQQFDTSKEAGEQSLDQWWTRDQTSWHRGAGIDFYEPGADDGTQYRFKSSAGVDVWTKGQASLLKKMSLVQATAPGQGVAVTTAVVDGVDAYFSVENGAVKRRIASGTTSYSGIIALTAVTVAGKKILAGTSTKLCVADANGSAFTDLWTNFTAAPTPYWAKSRIIAAAGASLYELTLAGGDVATQTPIHVHPDSTWTWTGVAESPTAILAAGKANGVGAIYRFALEDAGSGTTPKLGQAYQIAEFPPGEEVFSIKVYLGTYLAIGTSKGLRIGVLDGDSNVQYGPLIFTTTTPVRALSARDSYIYAGVENFIDGNGGAVRVNLAEPVDDSGLRFAYATDVQTHFAGQVGSIGFFGSTDRVVLAQAGQGVYLQSATDYELQGYLESGAMRFATTEPKSFRMAKVQVATNSGSVTLLTEDQYGTQASIITLADAYNPNDDIGLTAPSSAQSHLSLRLILRPSTPGTGTPVLGGYQVKALPQVRRQRLIEMPLLCLDRETDRFGVQTGYSGGAADRLFALEGLEDAQAVVLVQDFASGESYAAQVEKVSFDRTTPPTKADPNLGGIVTLTLRRL